MVLKRIFIYLRTTAKVVSIAIVAAIIIATIIILFFKPIYKVTVNGEEIGYCEDKKKIQIKLNDYMKNGDGTEENLAFVQIDEMPEFQLCMQKKGIETNDDEILNQIKEKGIVYYRYYSILLKETEKVYVASFNEAEEIIKELKEKDSANVSNLSIIERYETKMPTISEKATAISTLYEKKIVKKVTYSSSSSKLNYSNVNLGITLVKPVYGTLTSRYGYRWGKTHKGIDIGASTGTPIYASASGTVTFSGWNGAYGYLIIVSHSNGIQTYYAHCSKILVNVGQAVSAGEQIGKVGSTGRSTGPHLHFEIRVKGETINPQSYVGY